MLAFLNLPDLLKDFCARLSGGFALFLVPLRRSLGIAQRIHCSQPPFELQCITLHYTRPHLRSEVLGTDRQGKVRQGKVKRTSTYSALFFARNGRPPRFPRLNFVASLFFEKPRTIVYRKQKSHRMLLFYLCVDLWVVLSTFLDIFKLRFLVELSRHLNFSQYES